MKSTQNVEGIATNDKLIHPLLYKFLGGSRIFDDLFCSKKSSNFTWYVSIGWFNQLDRSCSFDSLVESGRRSGDGGIQIHYVDEGAPGVSMKHDYD